MSDLRDLFTAIKNLDMSFTNEATTTTTVTAHDLDEVKNKYERASMHTRLMLPLEELPGGGASSSQQLTAGAVGGGGMIEMLWNVADLYLHRVAVDEGGKLKASMPDLVRYADNYIQQIQSALMGTADCMSMANIQATAGNFEYPGGSGDQFHGVLVTMQWRKIY